MKRQQGFTLIELIVVIIILGILAATALPKFSNLTVDARIAKMNGLAASIKGAVAMAHGQSLAGLMAAASPVTLENGTRVDMQAYYPAASTSGIPAALEFVGSGYVSRVGPGVDEWDFWPDIARTNCVVRYYAASSVNATSAVPRVDDTAIVGVSGVSNCT